MFANIHIKLKKYKSINQIVHKQLIYAEYNLYICIFMHANSYLLKLLAQQF